ncbi:MAG: hypothetical protein QGG42_21105 [Phycisphaerae bacterium]|jgi:hypothetical protein|nr:hypothetical protein [Phycisphaerae bacterium]
MSQSPNTNPEKTSEGVPIDPDALMGRINSLSFFAVFLVSVLVHAALIGGTSVGYIQLCLEYKTLDPDTVIREKVKKEQAAERAKKRAERQEAEAKAVAGQKGKGSKGGTSTTKPKSKIEEKINQKSTTLPAKSGVKLDDIDDL